MTLLIPILAFAITSGQLIKVPIFTQGITILDITVFLFCLVGLLKLKFRFKRPPAQIIAIFAFLAVAGISLILTPLRLNLIEYFISASYIGRLFLYVLFAWLIYLGAFGSFNENIKKALLLSGISFALLGFLQFIFFPNLDFLTLKGWDPHYFRTVSSFLDPNFAGAFFVLTLIILVTLANTQPLWQFILVFTLIYLCLLTTFSRSSYFMFLISGLSFALVKRSKVIFLGALILFGLLLYGFQTYTQLISKPRNIDRGQSASLRLNTWQQGVELFKKFPVLGVGFNAYRYGIRELKLGDEGFLQSHGSTSNDFSLLFIASTTGILGTAVYLYFLSTLLKPFSRKNIIMISGVLGLLIHSFFANSLFYPPILLFVLLISVNPKK